jgi:hypothetical protein
VQITMSFGFPMQLFLKAHVYYLQFLHFLDGKIEGNLDKNLHLFAEIHAVVTTSFRMHI